jgi:hypothetical protein
MKTMPIQESSFLKNAQSMLGTQARSSKLRQGALAQKLLAMQHEKIKAMEDMIIAIMEARCEAQLKKVEDTTARKIEQENGKVEQAQARAIEAWANRENRKVEIDLNKKEELKQIRLLQKLRKIAQKKKDRLKRKG